MASVKMPTMDWGYTPLRDALKVFKARINLYFEDANITEDKKKAIKTSTSQCFSGNRIYTKKSPKCFSLNIIGLPASTTYKYF